MALIKQYQIFKVDLAGYCEIPFEEFRGKITPLRRKKSGWTAEEAAYVRSLADAGAGHALRAFFGERHPAAAEALGEAGLGPEPLTRAQLESHMRWMTKTLLAAGRTPERFVSYAGYLDSDLAPGHIEGKESLRALAESLFSGGSEDDKMRVSLEKDGFAEKFRRAGPAYKRIVREHLALAAEEAREPSAQ